MGGGGARIPEPSEGPVKALQAGGQLLGADRQRRAEPDGPRAARQQQDLLLLPHDRQEGVAFRGARQVEGAHQPPPQVELMRLLTVNTLSGISSTRRPAMMPPSCTFLPNATTSGSRPSCW